MLKSQSKFKTQMEDGTWDATVDGNTMTATDFSLDKLVGSRLIRRRTLEKYLTSSPVVEFGKDTYIIAIYFTLYSIDLVYQKLVIVINHHEFLVKLLILSIRLF